MDFFKIKTAEDLSNLHNLAFQNASNATKTTFYQSIKRVEKIYGKPLNQLNLDFINNPSQVIDKLKEKSYSENTITTTITNILKLLKIIDAPLIIYNKWLTILKDRTDARVKTEHATLQAKLKVLMDFKDIRESVMKEADIFSQGNEPIEDFKDFLILALFTLQLPVRVSNYVGMKVIEDEVYLNEDDNFLVLGDDYKFVFNKYRTSHLLGQKILLVKEPVLQFLIDKWLSEYNKESNNFLIVSPSNKRPMNGKQIEHAITKASKKLFNTPLSVENLRASYMKRIADLDPDFNDKMDIANILGFTNTSKLDAHTSD